MTTGADFDPIAELRKNWRAHSLGLPDKMSAAATIVRSNVVVIGRIDKALKTIGLNRPRYEVLLLLYFSRTGALPLNKIAQRMMIHPTSVTNLVDRLDAQGLIERQDVEGDRRVTLAVLTPKGVKAVEQGIQRTIEVEHGLGEFSERDAAKLQQLLGKLLGATDGAR